MARSGTFEKTRLWRRCRQCRSLLAEPGRALDQRCQYRRRRGNEHAKQVVKIQHLLRFASCVEKIMDENHLEAYVSTINCALENTKFRNFKRRTQCSSQIK